MTESLNVKKAIEVATSEAKSREKRGKAALEKIFSLLDEDATKLKKPVTSAIRSVPIPMKEDGETVTNLLRINPAIAVDGKLSVIVLDFYQPEDGHTQQWVVTADWKEGLPVLTDLDASQVQEDTTQFRLLEIAEAAGILLQEHSQQETLMAGSHGVIPFHSNTSSKMN